MPPRSKTNPIAANTEPADALPTAPLTTHAEGVADSLPAERLREQQNLGAQLVAAVTQDQIQFSQRIGERLGRRKLGHAFLKLVTVTDLLDLAQIKESKEYKGLQVIDGDGKVVTITSFSDYCRLVEGRSVESVDLDLANLKQLGADFMESMQRIGIGPGVMREIRKLPEEDRAAIEQATQADDKEALTALIDNLTARHAREKASLEQQAEVLSKKAAHLEADLAASREVAAKKTERIDRLEENLSKARHQLETQTPDDTFAAMRLELEGYLNTVIGELNASVRPSFDQIARHAEAHSLDASVFLAAKVVEIERFIWQVRQDFNLPAILSADETPEWAGA